MAEPLKKDTAWDRNKDGHFSDGHQWMGEDRSWMFDLYVSTNFDSDNRINYESKVSLSFDSELIRQKELTEKAKKIVNLIIFIP